MVTVAQAINELLYPVLGTLGIVLRAIGALGVGVVVGSLLHYVVVHKVQMRFYVPLIFFGIVALFAVAAWGRWSSPGTLAMLGIGLFVGYSRRPAPAESQGTNDISADSQ